MKTDWHWWNGSGSWF